MSLQWIATDFLTGRVLADLPGIECDYPLRATIGQYETATVHLHLDGAPPNWQDATREGGAVLHVYDDDDPVQTPQWSGWVSQQTRKTADDLVDLSLVTFEGYLDRRNVGDVTFTGTGQNDIIAALIAQFVQPGGPPVAAEYVTPGAPGTARDRAYLDADNASVYQRLTELMGVDGGPEFTTRWDWSADRESITPTVVFGDRIGQAAASGLASPNAMFEMPGCVIEAEQVRDYSAGKGANRVTAYSSGQGDTAPTSGPISAVDNEGRPVFEFRWTPSTSITDVSTLTSYATRAIALLAPGTRSLTLTAALEAAPRLGSAWQMGDDLGYQIGGLDGAGRDTVLAFPGGLAGVGRAIAYELTLDTITPILAVPDPTGGA